MTIYAAMAVSSQHTW